MPSKSKSGKFVEFLKTQRRHVRCVMCGHGLTSEYETQIDAFPIYHTAKTGRPFCEVDFYSTLVRIYLHIHHQGSSISISALIHDLDWVEPIQLKKEMVTWCLGRGYLAMDSLKRIEVPPPVAEACLEMFEMRQLQSFDGRAHAVEILSAALKCVKNELHPVAQEDMPLKYDTPDHGSVEDIEGEVEPAEDEPGMHTTEQTGASDYNKRTSSVQQSIEQFRS